MKLSNPLRSKFLSANATLGVPTLVRLFVGLVKSKTSALLIGTTGVGIVGIGSQIQNLGVSCTSLGASSGLIRELSKCLALKDQTRKRELLGTSFTLQLIVNIPLMIVALLLLRPLARYTFGSEEDFTYLIPIIATVPLQSVMVSHLWGVFYAHGRLEYLARASVIAALVEAVAYISLVRIYGIAGAFWGITVGMVTWFTFVACFATHLEKARDLFHLNLKRQFIKELLSTGAIMTMTGALTYLTNALIRIKITHSLGGPFAGIYQVVMALTAYYIPYFTNGVWGRLFPKISAGGLSTEGMYEWSEAMILCAVLAAGIQIVLMAAVGPLVFLIYSRDFASAIPLVPLQFVGDLFYLISVPCLGVIIGLNCMYLYIVIWVLYYGAFYGIAVHLMDRMGLQGPVIAYTLSNLGLFSFCLIFYFRKSRNSAHLWPTLISVAMSVTAVLIQAALCLHVSSLAARLVMPVIWGTVCGAVLLLPKMRKILMIHGYSGSKLPVPEIML